MLTVTPDAAQFVMMAVVHVIAMVMLHVMMVVVEADKLTLRWGQNGEEERIIYQLLSYLTLSNMLVYLRDGFA